MTQRPRRTIAAADANRKFSELLREVRDGADVVITVHGKPVARMGPIDAEAAQADDARVNLLKRLRRQRALNAAKWSRESLYTD